MKCIQDIQTNFEGELKRISVFLPGKTVGQRTDFEKVDSNGRISFVTSELDLRCLTLTKYKGDSVIEY